MHSCVTGLIKKTQGPDTLWLNTPLRTKHYCVNENIQFGLFTQSCLKPRNTPAPQGRGSPTFGPARARVCAVGSGGIFPRVVVRIGREKEGEALGRAPARQGHCSSGHLSPPQPGSQGGQGLRSPRRKNRPSSLFLLRTETLEITGF